MTNTTSPSDLHLDLLVHAPAARLRDAISDVEGWWSTRLDRNGDEFTVHFEQNWTRVRAEAGRWTITGQDTPAIPIPDEWVGDVVTFDVEEVDEASSVLHFTHSGLLDQQCAEECRPAWQHYTASLVALAETGTGNPWAPGLSSTGQE